MPRGFDKERTLGTCWSKQDKNWRLYYPFMESGWTLDELLKSETFREFIEEIEELGFDSTTLRLSIQKRNNTETQGGMEHV
ncbi:hypothetical protein [Rossellomorea marisflavi]|uniref:hypothetical protein n=1 Tax=Rossellomorea marisflavi TaxID=189381 RepID=UPI003FA13DC3